MSHKAYKQTPFTVFPVICSQPPITRTPANSNLFRFPLEARVIGIQLYIASANVGKENIIIFPAW